MSMYILTGLLLQAVPLLGSPSSASSYEDTALAGISLANYTQFYHSKFPDTVQTQESVVSSPWVMFRGIAQKLQYRELTRSGNVYGPSGTVMGGPLDKYGNRIVGLPGTTNSSRLSGAFHAGEHMVSDMVDFASILRSKSSNPRRLWAVVHHEDKPAGTQVVEVLQHDDGMLIPKEVYNVDFSLHNGLVGTCAGSVSPWNTHLGGEEWGLPSAREFESWSSDLHVQQSGYIESFRYYGVDGSNASVVTLADVQSKFHPYMNNYPNEIEVDDSMGHAPPKISAVKHYSMGRYAIELPYCLSTSPQVCYIMDDHVNGIPCAYVPDTANDLSAGRLFCAQITMELEPDLDSSLGGAGEFSVAWIALGHATDALIKQHIDAGTRFKDLFDAEVPNATATERGYLCSAGFTGVNVGDGPECLKLIGDPVIASRLETRRYSAMLGATTEWTKMEGITFDPVRNELFMAMSSIYKSMEDSAAYGNQTNHHYDLGGFNNIRAKYNPCGCVYRMPLNDDNFFTYIRPLVCGNPKTMNTGVRRSGHDTNKCDIFSIANPDNIAFMTGHDKLFIGEDTGLHHNNAVWVYDMDTQSLTRILTIPKGAEATGVYWHSDINGFAYIMTQVQHPSHSAYGHNGTVGYIGPIALNMPACGSPDLSASETQKDLPTPSELINVAATLRLIPHTLFLCVLVVAHVL